MNLRCLRCAALLAMAGALPGCGENSPPPGAPMGQPSPVHGQVRLPGGAPLKGGMISFMPDEIEVGNKIRYESSALIDAKGMYEAGFNGDKSGAVPGEYKVTVMPRDYMELRGSNSSQIPKVYRELKTTPLKLSVKEQDNTFDILLK